MYNLCLLTDSYKLTHWKQYPPGTEYVYSYFESRGGEFPQTVFFGLQYIIKKYLQTPFINPKQARKFTQSHLSEDYFNYDGWEHIIDHHNCRLPVRIKAVPEGYVVPNGNVLITIENTDPECYWLTNYLETLLVQVWYGCTVATLSYYIKRLIRIYLEETGSPELIDSRLHDFGFRGVSSVEYAGIGGAAHLLNFSGTDNLAGITLAYDFYNASVMPGISIPAAEHSTITAWGEERETEAMGYILDQFPTGPVSVVSDSWDIFRACNEIWGRELRQKVIDRPGTVVIRPDSGDPPEVVIRVLNILGYAFGYTRNYKGYKVLHPKIRIIQGDGVDYQTIESVLSRMKYKQWSADNIVFGMGGALLQKLNRDTQKFAFKCSNITINGHDRPVSKNPITDKGKRSKAGKLKLVLENVAHGSCYSTVPLDCPGEDHLLTVFENGDLKLDYSFDECRIRTKTDTMYWV